MSTEKLSNCSETWKRIFKMTPNKSPFLSYEWFSALCKNLLKTNPEIMIFKDDGSSVGILPAIVENGTIRFIGDTRVTDMVDILFIFPYKKQILSTLSSHIISKCWSLDLFPLNKNSPIVKLLPKFMDDIVVEKSDPKPLLKLPDSWEEYLSNLKSKQRHEVRRKLRKAEGVIIKSINSEQIGMLFDLMSLSSNEKGEFLGKDVREFFRRLAESFSKKGWLRFQASYFDSKPVCMLFSFKLNDVIYLYNMGFDTSFSSISPGIITVAEDIREAINEGFRYYDFLRGGERYKYNLGAEKVYTRRVRR